MSKKKIKINGLWDLGLAPQNKNKYTNKKHCIIFFKSLVLLHLGCLNMWSDVLLASRCYLWINNNCPALLQGV